MMFRASGAKVVKANLLYTDIGGDRHEEWYRVEADVAEGRVEATLPEKTTHYVFNLIDENHYLVSYPEVKLESDRSENYSAGALSAR